MKFTEGFAAKLVVPTGAKAARLWLSQVRQWGGFVFR